ncbi:diguanylate cyclase [Leptolyngbyaceae cyanobacterium CCMR0082]|uniref:Diguanylate cyclase n=2 Tax=Adonisia TaxID=2950183 RepID=A0A6M0S9D8_9CYAN|nr:diguanylate cyclase [Adonisia turfae CCMR0082]
MYHRSFSKKSSQLQTLLPVKSSVCDEPGWCSFWHTVSASIRQFHQSLEPSSRMACFSDPEDALDHAQQLQRQIQQQIDLRETIRRIRQVLLINDIYKTVVQSLMDFFQADSIFLLENAPGCWQSVESSLCSTSNAHQTNALNDYLGLESVIAKLEQPFPIMVNDQSVLQLPVHQQWLSQFPGSWLLGPIHLPHKRQTQTLDKPWGIVAIGRKDQANIWTKDELEHAKVLVDEIAIALHHSLSYEQLRRENQDLQSLALTDSLTGLANRRRFDRYFDAEWQRLARDQKPLTLILCDIDYFKRYNDYYGHPTGDICLAKVSDILTRCIRRPADLVARYGGEEFAVILPNTDTGGGHSVALAIKDLLAKAAIPHATSGIAEDVTLTMGIATVIPGRHLASQDLLQAADLALYHAKQQGRDRIYVHAHYCMHEDDYPISNNKLEPITHDLSSPDR